MERAQRKEVIMIWSGRILWSFLVVAAVLAFVGRIYIQYLWMSGNLSVEEYTRLTGNKVHIIEESE